MTDLTDQGQIKAKREAAARARRLAQQLTSEPDRTRALEFADELDAEADALAEGLAKAPERAVPPAAQVTQIQMQVQQAPPLKDEDTEKDDGDKNES
jgi:hypothetical protein